MTKIGKVLLFSEPETCPEVPYPLRERAVSDVEAEKLEHRSSYSARVSYEPQGWTVA